MGELVRWFFDHAAQLIESVGIMMGLFFTGFALRSDVRSRQAEILMRLYHDERPELKRIFQNKVDLAATPITPAEARFIQYFVNHVALSFRAQKLGLYRSPEQLETDLRDFFGYPVPREAWKKLRRFQDQDFAEYIEKVLTN
jgi:hypothetical protein